MSQFDALFKTNAEEKKEGKPKSKTAQPKKKKETASVAADPPPSSATPHAAPKALEQKKQIVKEKRASGKSSNPDYTQVLTYIRRETHNAVRAALIYDDERRDLSDLVEELLASWVQKKKTN